VQDEVLQCERTLLHTIAFDLIVQKPHNYLVTYLVTGASFFLFPSSSSSFFLFFVFFYFNEGVARLANMPN